MQHEAEGSYKPILYMHGKCQWMSLLFLACEAHGLVANKLQTDFLVFLCLKKIISESRNSDLQKNTSMRTELHFLFFTRIEIKLTLTLR